MAEEAGMISLSYVIAGCKRARVTFVSPHQGSWSWIPFVFLVCLKNEDWDAGALGAH